MTAVFFFFILFVLGLSLTQVFCAKISVGRYFPELAEKAQEDGCEMWLERHQRYKCFKKWKIVGSRTRCIRVVCHYNTEYYQVITLFSSIETDILHYTTCLLYTSPSPRDLSTSRMPSSA